jgi:transposase-like protein
VAVSQSREAGVTIKEIAIDFGISVACLRNCCANWMLIPAEGLGSPLLSPLRNRELRRRNRLFEQENEVLRRAAAYLSHANLPGKGSTHSLASEPLKELLSR